MVTPLRLNEGRGFRVLSLIMSSQTFSISGKALDQHAMETIEEAGDILQWLFWEAQIATAHVRTVLEIAATGPMFDQCLVWGETPTI